jgi:hypothetical protein
MEVVHHREHQECKVPSSMYLISKQNGLNMHHTLKIASALPWVAKYSEIKKF